MQCYLPRPIGAGRGGLCLASGHRYGHLGTCLGRPGDVHTALGLLAGDDGVAAFHFQIGHRVGRRLVHRERAGAGGGVAQSVGAGDRQCVLAVGQRGRQRNVGAPRAIGIGGGLSRQFGNLLVAVDDAELQLGSGLGHAGNLDRLAGLRGVDGVVGAGNLADDGLLAGGVHRDLRGGFRAAVAGGIQRGHHHCVVAVGLAQRGTPFAIGAHRHQPGRQRTHLQLHRPIGLGGAGEGHALVTFAAGDDVVVRDGRDFRFGRRRVVEGHGGLRQDALHPVVHAHHFHGVAVGQAGGRQFASAGFGGLQIHRPVAGGVRRGGVGDVGALVAVGVDAQLHFRARLCRAGNGGEARVEVGATLERQRDVALRWQATVTAAATTTAQGQTQHGRATQAIQQGFGRAIAQHGQDGGLEAGVVQHEVAVRQGAQRLGAYVGQHLAGAAQFAAGHGFGAGRTVVHAHGAAVGGAADAVVAFQDNTAGFGGCALTNPFGRSGSRARRRRRNALDHQVTVDLQHAQLFGVHVGPVQAELLSGSHQHTVLAGPELQMFDTAVVCSLNVKSCHGAFPAAKSAWIKGWGMGSGKSGGRCGVVRRDGNVNVWWFTP